MRAEPADRWIGRLTLVLALAGPAALGAQAIPELTDDRIVRLVATDGTPLEGKLSLPRGRRGPVPVVMMLHGAGPRTFDHALRYRDAAGQVRTMRYYDHHAWLLAERGIAFFRISKRGVSADSTGRPSVDRAVFSTATPSVLLDDYRRALEGLRREPGVDSTRIILMGSSEGTRLAPRLVQASPSGIRGLVLMSYAADNSQQTVVWQNTTGPWRNVRALIPAADDDTLTRAEHEAAVQRSPRLAQQLPFASIDPDGNGVATASDLAALVRPRLDAILAAVRDGGDDLLWQAVVNLTSAYLREDWDGPPTAELLLRVPVPVAILHGRLDGATRVDGVAETVEAFRRAGRRDLTVRLYDRLDHDMGWTTEAAAAGGPEAFRDAFDLAAKLLRGP